MIGTRLFADRYAGLRLAEGSYGKDLRGRWWVRPPGESMRRPIENSRVVEFADGTVTVRGIINGGLTCFSLERGIWTQLK